MKRYIFWVQMSISEKTIPINKLFLVISLIFLPASGWDCHKSILEELFDTGPCLRCTRWSVKHQFSTTEVLWKTGKYISLKLNGENKLLCALGFLEIHTNTLTPLLIYYFLGPFSNILGFCFTVMIFINIYIISRLLIVNTI